MHILLFFSGFLPKGSQRLACQLLNCLFAANTPGINYSIIKILLSLFFTALGLKLTTLHIISSTLYIFYYVQLSFCTLSAQTHMVHIICMLSTHVHIICLSSLPLLIYLSIHNLVSTHCLHTCILCVTMSSVYCLEMHMLCTCHLSYFVVFL